MMQQRVKNIAYLSEVIVDLASVPVTGQDVIMLPRYASVIDVKIEVLDLPTDTITQTLNLELKEGGVKFFDKAQIAKNDNAKRYLSSIAHTTITGNDIIIIKPSAAIAGGKVKVKALFYLPSEILAEI